MKIITPLTLACLSIVATARIHAQNTFQASGNVGIGTTNPQVPLDFGTSVANQKRIIGTYTQPNLFTGIGMDSATAGIRLAGDPMGVNPLLDVGYYSMDGSFTWKSRAYFRADGNVGIGTAAPGYKLDIAVPTSGEPTLLKLSGRATGGIQMRVGDDYAGALGTRYSGADTFVSSNSYQSTLNTDSWTKGVSTYGSTVAVLGISPAPTSPAFQVKYSPANMANGGMSSFFTSDLLTILGNGNVGVGTVAPAGRIHVSQPGGGAYQRNSDIVIQRSDADNTTGKISFITNAGINGTRWEIVSDADIGNDFGFSFNGSKTLQILASGNVGIGTTSPTEKLSVKGKIRAQEVIVETAGWSDYVFADDYKLQSLSEVETQIKTNKHLPGVPSAQEVVEKGVSLGDMQAVLLAKIEELTLHQIAQEKQLNALKAKNSELQTRVEQLSHQ